MHTKNNKMKYYELLKHVDYGSNIAIWLYPILKCCKQSKLISLYFIGCIHQGNIRCILRANFLQSTPFKILDFSASDRFIILL